MVSLLREDSHEDTSEQSTNWGACSSTMEAGRRMPGAPLTLIATVLKTLEVSQ